MIMGSFNVQGRYLLKRTVPAKTSGRSSNSQNQPEIEAAGMALPDRLQSLTLTWSVLAATIKEAQLSTGYRSAMRLSSKRIAIHPRVARWLWKANADSDTTDQFLALWIALNVLYGQYQVKGKRERDAIEAFANHMVGPNATQVLSAILALSGDQCLQVLTDRWLMLRPGFRVGSALRAALTWKIHEE
jgi:hypothetical protein